MRNIYITVATAAVVTAVFVSCRTAQPRSPEEIDLLKESGVTEQSVAREELSVGLPETGPSDIPLYYGVTKTDVFVDTTRSDNYFYSVNEPLFNVKQFYTTMLPDFSLSEQGQVSATLEREQNGYRTSIFLSTTRPSIYPEGVADGMTYVSVSYNLKPKPTLDELIGNTE